MRERSGGASCSLHSSPVKQSLQASLHSCALREAASHFRGLIIVLANQERNKKTEHHVAYCIAACRDNVCRMAATHRQQQKQPPPRQLIYANMIST